MKTQFTVILLGVLAVSLCAVVRGQKPGKWEVLFDGKSIDALRGYRQAGFPASGWAVEKGTLHALPGGSGDLVSREKYRDFELELEWRVSAGGNSGVFYRATEDNEWIWQSAAEYQVLDDAKHRDGAEPKTSAGSLYALIAPTEKTVKPAGEWNSTRIVAHGNHVEHWLNGKKVVEFEFGSEALGKLILASKFSSLPAFGKSAEGHIGLQHHGEEVWFRNVRIRRLG